MQYICKLWLLKYSQKCSLTNNFCLVILKKNHFTKTIISLQWLHNITYVNKWIFTTPKNILYQKYTWRLAMHLRQNSPCLLLNNILLTQHIILSCLILYGIKNLYSYIMFIIYFYCIYYLLCVYICSALHLRRKIKYLYIFISKRFRLYFGNVQMFPLWLDKTFVSCWYFKKNNTFRVKHCIWHSQFFKWVICDISTHTIKPFERTIRSIRKIRHITYKYRPDAMRL